MKGERSEGMRLDLRGQCFATEVVLLLKLGRNEVFDYLSKTAKSTKSTKESRKSLCVDFVNFVDLAVSIFEPLPCNVRRTAK
jgi:hypothetical protein